MGSKRRAQFASSIRGAAESPREGGLPAQDAPAGMVLVPPLERPRPRRRSIVPAWAWAVPLLLVAVSVIGVLVARWAATRSHVEVPRVTGLMTGVARTRLHRLGLELNVAEERFDARAKGTILSQQPPAGTRVEAGSVVEVVVSGGTEEFRLPDVVGDGRRLAEGLLKGRGLAVEIEHVVSEAPSDTVVGTVPSPGSVVRTGQTVRLLVSAPRGSSVLTRPFRLDGVSVVIDPAPPPRGTADVAAEIARRLEALLTASNATVEVTRSTLETAADEGVRAQRAAEPSATVAVGLTVTTGARAGRVVAAPPAAAVQPSTGGAAFGEALVTALRSAAPPVTRTVTTYDPVLSRTSGAWARVIVGSATAPEDASVLQDKVWIDRVARAIYEAIGARYGEALVR